MPFTLSHVAAVLPLSRRLAHWRLLSASLIGSMVPDFGFLMPWRPARVETHSAWSLLTFCLPVGWVTFWVFQRWVKPPLFELLPDGAHRRWAASAAPADVRDARQWLLAAAGILAGAVTHLVWDAFTHEGARGIRMIPALDDPIVEIAGHHLAGARMLQDGSSLLGLFIVSVVGVYALRPGVRTAAAAPTRRLRPAERLRWVLGYAALAVTLAVVFLLARHSPAALAQSLGLLLGYAAIAALRGGAAALLIVAAGLYLRLRPTVPGSTAAQG